MERNPERDFTNDTKKQERIASNHSCRICGESKQLLECAHIYSQSMNDAWDRKGASRSNWKKNEYVASVNNCILLCPMHHSRIDSIKGLDKVTVTYLESLKSDLRHCTALVGPPKGEWQRCKKMNGRDKMNGSYRCSYHQDGGNEDTLPLRGWHTSKMKTAATYECLSCTLV